MVLSNELASAEPCLQASAAENKIDEPGKNPKDAWNIHNLIGQDYGNLRLLCLLGVGELGPVFLARDLTSQARLAVKILRPDLHQHASKIRAYFKTAQTVSHLETPHILPVKECHSQPSGRNYVVMEALNGFLISNAVDACMPIPLVSKLDTALQVANALAIAHDQGITHQCLSARNIFLVHRPNQTYSARILDFGISELLLEPSPNESQKYQRDIQSYGKIFWEWIQTTSAPQSIPSTTLEELKALFQQCIQAPPTHPNEFMGWVRRELTRISKTHPTDEPSSLTNSDKPIHSDDEIDWAPSPWKRKPHLRFNSRFAKIGLSVATLGVLATLTIFQLPVNANADRKPSTSAQIATLATTDHVVKGSQISASNKGLEADERNVVEKQDVEKTPRLNDSNPIPEEANVMKLKFVSSPMGAEVREVGSDVVLGITPFTIKISRDKRGSVFAFQKAGFLAAAEKFTIQGDAPLGAILGSKLKPLPTITPKSASPEAKAKTASPFVAKAPTKSKSTPKRSKSSSSTTRKKTKQIKPNKKPQPKPKLKKAPSDQRAIIDPFAEE